MKIPRLFENDPPSPITCRIDGEILEKGQLFDIFCIRIVGEEVEFPVAVGKEIYQVANPHRAPVVTSSGRLRDLLNGKCLQVTDPYIRDPPSPVIFPLLECRIIGTVSYLFCIGREAPVHPTGQFHFFRETPIDRDQVEVRKGVGV